MRISDYNGRDVIILTSGGHTLRGRLKFLGGGEEEFLMLGNQPAIDGVACEVIEVNCEKVDAICVRGA